eukprot:tig00020531_g10048.t1
MRREGERIAANSISGALDSAVRRVGREFDPAGPARGSRWRGGPGQLDVGRDRGAHHAPLEPRRPPLPRPPAPARPAPPRTGPGAALTGRRRFEERAAGDWTVAVPGILSAARHDAGRPKRRRAAGPPAGGAGCVRCAGPRDERGASPVLCPARRAPLTPRSAPGPRQLPEGPSCPSEDPRSPVRPRPRRAARPTPDPPRAAVPPLPPGAPALLAASLAPRAPPRASRSTSAGGADAARREGAPVAWAAGPRPAPAPAARPPRCPPPSRGALGEPPSPPPSLPLCCPSGSSRTSGGDAARARAALGPAGPGPPRDPPRPPRRPAQTRGHRRSCAPRPPAAPPPSRLMGGSAEAAPADGCRCAAAALDRILLLQARPGPGPGPSRPARADGGADGRDGAGGGRRGPRAAGRPGAAPPPSTSRRCWRPAPGRRRRGGRPRLAGRRGALLGRARRPVGRARRPPHAGGGAPRPTGLG